MLSRPEMVHPINNRPIYLKERLSKDDVILKIHAEKEKNMVTTTFNSQVKVFVKTANNKTISKIVRSKRDVDNLTSVALQKRNKFENNSLSNFNRGPLQQNGKTTSKRPLEDSPTNSITTPNVKITNQSNTPDGN